MVVLEVQKGLHQDGGTFLEDSLSLPKSSRGNFYGNKDSSPGPGSYNTFSTFGGPKAVISGRFARNSTDQVPGPGQYNPDTSVRYARTAFQYTMGGRPATSAKDSAPGPGSYDVNRSQSKGGIGVRFGRESRKGLNHSASQYVPGPGSYGVEEYISKRSTAPRYT